MNDYIETDAELSADERYRYRLRRAWRKQPGFLLWVMLNPSTANALKDDATIRKCVGFAKRWGYGAIEVVNLYALRATRPDELVLSDDPIGPENDEWIRQFAAKATGICAGWGSQKLPLFKQRVRDVLAMIPCEVACIGKTRDGFPRHPSRPSYATPLEIYADQRRQQ